MEIGPNYRKPVNVIHKIYWLKKKEIVYLNRCQKSNWWYAAPCMSQNWEQKALNWWRLPRKLLIGEVFKQTYWIWRGLHNHSPQHYSELFCRSYCSGYSKKSRKNHRYGKGGDKTFMLTVWLQENQLTGYENWWETLGVLIMNLKWSVHKSYKRNVIRGFKRPK